MKKMLFILGVFILSLGFSNVYAQTPFAPVVIKAYAASDGGDIRNPTVNFYSVSNPAVLVFSCTWYGILRISQGSSTGVNYAPIPPGTYNIEFIGNGQSSSCSPTRIASILNVKLEADKGCYNLDVYVKCQNRDSYISLVGPTKVN